MKKIVLHIGFGKTGSSYLQTCFAKYENHLLSAGYLYPDEGSHQLAREGKVTSGNANSLSWYLNSEKAPSSFDISAFEAYFKSMLLDNKNYNLLFSSEFMAGFDSESLLQLQSLAALCGYQVSIVAYVRSIAGHAYSNYVQQIKRQLYQESFYHYLQYDYSELPFSAVFRLQASFDSESYIVRNYDKAKDSLFEDFWVNGLRLDPPLFTVERQTINRSLDDYELECMRVMNGRFAVRQHAVKVSDALIYAQPEKPVQFTLAVNELELLEVKYAKLLDELNQCLDKEQQIVLVDHVFKIGVRETVVLDQFQHLVLSLLARGVC